MSFSITHSDAMEVFEHIKKHSNGSSITLEIDVNDNRLMLKYVNKLEESCLVTIYRATTDNTATYFPTITKTGRLND
jgi:hypothetical protein